MILSPNPNAGGPSDQQPDTLGPAWLRFSFGNMRSLLLLILCCVAGCSATNARISPSATLRKEKVEFEAAQGGSVRIEKTYRGEEHIMTVMTQSNVTTRSLHLRGEVKYIEADEDGDGHFESVMLPGQTVYDFEAFRRRNDGSLEPLSEQDYLELKSKAGRATDAMREAFREAGSGSEAKD